MALVDLDLHECLMLPIQIAPLSVRDDMYFLESVFGFIEYIITVQYNTILSQSVTCSKCSKNKRNTFVLT